MFSLNSVTKIFVIKTCHLLWHAITVPVRPMWETGSLNWAQFMIRFPEFAEVTEFNESSAPFKQNPDGAWNFEMCLPADLYWLRRLECALCHTLNTGVKSHQFLNTQVCWSKRLRFNVGCQEVSRYHTRGESKEYCTQVRDPPWFWKPRKMSPEVQNRGINSPTKGLISSKKFKKKMCQRF